MKFRGSCHCGSVAFEVEGELKTVLSCNCSICQRKGSLLWFLPRDAFKLLTPEENSRVYEFNKHKIKHRFCPQCGIHPYAEGEDTDLAGNVSVAVNVRCLEGIELESLKVNHFDGRSI